MRRFWEACSLPDFRSLGVEQHARFVARLWDDLQGGYIGADFVAARIAELDRMQGDIDNRVKPILDALVDNLVTADDRHAQSVTVRRCATVPPDEAHVTIRGVK